MNKMTEYEVGRYRKRPVEVHAARVHNGAWKRIAEWCGGEVIRNGRKVVAIVINTLEGKMWAREGDYIIKGVAGEFYPCKPDIFHETYVSLDHPLDKKRTRA